MATFATVYASLSDQIFYGVVGLLAVLAALIFTAYGGRIKRWAERNADNPPADAEDRFMHDLAGEGPVEAVSNSFGRALGVPYVVCWFLTLAVVFGLGAFWPDTTEGIMLWWVDQPWIVQILIFGAIAVPASFAALVADAATTDQPTNSSGKGSITQETPSESDETAKTTNIHPGPHR